MLRNAGFITVVFTGIATEFAVLGMRSIVDFIL